MRVISDVFRDIEYMDMHNDSGIDSNIIIKNEDLYQLYYGDQNSQTGEITKFVYESNFYD
jgi:hypothetical protein